MKLDPGIPKYQPFQEIMQVPDKLQKHLLPEAGTGYYRSADIDILMQCTSVYNKTVWYVVVNSRSENNIMQFISDRRCEGLLLYCYQNDQEMIMINGSIGLNLHEQEHMFINHYNYNYRFKVLYGRGYYKFLVVPILKSEIAVSGIYGEDHLTYSYIEKYAIALGEMFYVVNPYRG